MNQRILIVDDEKDIVQAYVDFLAPQVSAPKRSSRSAPAAGAPAASPSSFEILKAYSGEEAVKIFQEELAQGRRVAGGFFDVKMDGGMDGLQTIQELWKLDPDLHCTVVTAYHDRDVNDIDQLFGERFKDQWDYLNKPFTQAEIVQKARQMTAAWNRKRKLEQTQQQLIHSERMAAIGQVARAIGHEFGNILQAIIGKTDLALEESDLAKAKDKLKHILQAAERANLIVRNLRSFSKNSTAPVPSQLQASIQATLTLLNHELKKNSIEVIDQSASTQAVMVNPSEIEQVLMNLLINATHAMPAGGKVEIGCKDEGASAVAWVADTGTGIRPDDLPRIFEYAFTTKGDKGSGLGLSISKEIVEKHGGTISVETELGKGTRFTLRFPHAGQT